MKIIILLVFVILCIGCYNDNMLSEVENPSEYLVAETNGAIDTLNAYYTVINSTGDILLIDTKTNLVEYNIKNYSGLTKFMIFLIFLLGILLLFLSFKD